MSNIVILKNNNIIGLLYLFLFSSLRSLVLNENVLYLYLGENINLLNILNILKDFYLFQFTQLLDIFGVDMLNLNSNYSFDVNYVLVSVLYNVRIIITASLPLYGVLSSVVSVFSSSTWLEREVWDMYGVFFYNHPDLRRILTDYGFTGHPLSNDFPLIGFVEVSYDERVRSVVIEPIELMQDVRLFNIRESSW